MNFSARCRCRCDDAREWYKKGTNSLLTFEGQKEVAEFFAHHHSFTLSRYFTIIYYIIIIYYIYCYYFWYFTFLRAVTKCGLVGQLVPRAPGLNRWPQDHLLLEAERWTHSPMEHKWIIWSFLKIWIQIKSQIVNLKLSIMFWFLSGGNSKVVAIRVFKVAARRANKSRWIRWSNESWHSDHLLHVGAKVGAIAMYGVYFVSQLLVLVTKQLEKLWSYCFEI